MTGARHVCLFCGGDASDADHLARCDGRQGAKEAAADVPVLISGLVAETWNTSAAAARSVDETKETQRRQVLEAIRATGADGATDDELQMRLGLDGSSERPRRWELWKLAHIAIRRDAGGDPVRRLTRTNRRAVVWIATVS